MFASSYTSYRSWLENCKYLQSQTIAELQKCIQLREEMNRCRQLAFSQRLAQFDSTNFVFRKRIFETKLVLDELKWQKQMVNITLVLCMYNLYLNPKIVSFMVREVKHLCSMKYWRENKNINYQK